MENIKKGDWVICVDVSGNELAHSGQYLRLHKEYFVEQTVNCICGF